MSQTSKAPVSPASVLRVRGGRPLTGGPSLDTEELKNYLPDAVTNINGESEDDHKPVIHAGRPRGLNAPKSILRTADRENFQLPESQFPLVDDDTEELVDRYKPAYPNDCEETADHYPQERPSIPPAPKEEIAVIPITTTLTKSKTPFSHESSIREKDIAVKEQKELLMFTMDIFKSYRKGKNSVPVLNGVNLGIREGEFLSIIGQSGSGKSTLLHLLGTLDVPDSGMIHFEGQRIDNVPRAQRDYLRNNLIGMIFQFYHLLPELTTLENVLSPLMIRHGVVGYLLNRRQYREKAMELLEKVGLSHRWNHKPSELSGGEMQRAAIARSLVTDPHVLLADEPTGNLDSRTSAEIMSLLRTLNEDKNLTIVMVTHDNLNAERADRTIRLVDGKVV